MFFANLDYLQNLQFSKKLLHIYLKIKKSVVSFLRLKGQGHTSLSFSRQGYYTERIPKKIVAALVSMSREHNMKNWNIALIKEISFVFYQKKTG